MFFFSSVLVFIIVSPGLSLFLSPSLCVFVCSQMYYYRYENAEVSCCYKYLMFSYNIIFWVSP